MKAEHRKELQTNVLADRLGKLYEGMKTGPQTKSTAIWVVVGLIAVVVAAWWYFQHTPPLPWTDLQNAEGPKLSALAQNYRGTPLSRAARFQEARTLLDQGQRLLAQYPEGALKDLADASQRYQDLAAECTDDPILREEALLGVATAEENRGQLEQAQEWYEKLAKAAPNSPWGQRARARADAIAHERQAGGGPEIDFYQKFQAELAKAGRRP